MPMHLAACGVPVPVFCVSLRSCVACGIGGGLCGIGGGGGLWPLLRSVPLAASVAVACGKQAKRKQAAKRFFSLRPVACGGVLCVSPVACGIGGGIGGGLWPLPLLRSVYVVVAACAAAFRCGGGYLWRRWRFVTCAAFVPCALFEKAKVPNITGSF